MTVYVVVLCLLVIMDLIMHPRTSVFGRKMYAFFSFGLLGGLAAVRKYTVGNDLHYLYYALFKRCCETDFGYFFSRNRRIEPGFLVFFKAISFISENPQVMIIVHSLIVIGCFCFFFYRHCEDLPLSFFLFVTMNHWFYCMVIMRQILAVCVAIIACDVLWSKMRIVPRVILFSLLLGLAMSFHYSAFVIVSFGIFRHMRMTGKTFAFFSLISVLVFSSLNILEWFLGIVESFLAVSGIIGRQYSYFSTQVLKNAKYTMSGLYGFVPYLLTFVIGGYLLINWKVHVVVKTSALTKDYSIKKRTLPIDSCEYSDDFLLYMVLVVVFLRILSFRIPIFSRFAQYFMPYEYVLMGRISGVIHNPYVRMLMVIVIYIITGLAFYMMNSSLRLNEIMTGTVPYEFFWQ